MNIIMKPENETLTKALNGEGLEAVCLRDVACPLGCARKNILGYFKTHPRFNYSLSHVTCNDCI